MSLQEGACTMGVSTNMPRHPLTLATPQATPSRRRTHPPSQVEESTLCVCISMSLSNPNHTTQVCLKNTHVFQPPRLVNLRQSQLGRPNSSDVDPPISLVVLACTRV